MAKTPTEIKSPKEQPVHQAELVQSLQRPTTGPGLTYVTSLSMDCSAPTDRRSGAFPWTITGNTDGVSVAFEIVKCPPDFFEFPVAGWATITGSGSSKTWTIILQPANLAI